MSTTAYTIGKQENLLQGHYAVQHYDDLNGIPYVGVYMQDRIVLMRINGVLSFAFGRPAVLEAYRSGIVALL